MRDRERREEKKGPEVKDLWVVMADLGGGGFANEMEGDFLMIFEGWGIRAWLLGAG